MSEQQERAFLGTPDNYMLGVFDDGDEAERAHEALVEAGFGGDDVMLCIAAESIDSTGEVHGPLARLKRAIDHLLTNKSHLAEYDEAAREGACVIGVHAEDEQARDQAQQIFREHGARNVNFFGKWVVETLDGGPRGS
jgi:hypothetical protein